jgi:hypothetical protein
MKVIRTRAGAAVASCGLLAGGFVLTVVAASSAVPTAVAVTASAASPQVCSNATLIDASRCRPL